MVRLHHTHTCSVYNFWTTITKGSSVQTKSALYTNIPCDFWKKRTSYWEGPLAVQQSANAYEFNFAGNYTWITIGDIIMFDSIEYKVDDVVPHKRRGVIDNYQVFVSKTTTQV